MLKNLLKVMHGVENRFLSTLSYQMKLIQKKKDDFQKQMQQTWVLDQEN